MSWIHLLILDTFINLGYIINPVSAWIRPGCRINKSDYDSGPIQISNFEYLNENETNSSETHDYYRDLVPVNGRIIVRCNLTGYFGIDKNTNEPLINGLMICVAKDDTFVFETNIRCFDFKKGLLLSQNTSSRTILVTQPRTIRVYQPALSDFREFYITGSKVNVSCAQHFQIEFNGSSSVRWQESSVVLLESEFVWRPPLASCKPLICNFSKLEYNTSSFGIKVFQTLVFENETIGRGAHVTCDDSFIQINRADNSKKLEQILKCEMRADGTPFWDFDSFSWPLCIQKGLLLPQNTSSRSIHVTNNKTISDPQFSIPGLLGVFSTVNVSCATKLQHTHECPLTGSSRNGSLRWQESRIELDEHKQPVWSPSLSDCEPVACESLQLSPPKHAKCQQIQTTDETQCIAELSNNEPNRKYCWKIWLSKYRRELYKVLREFIQHRYDYLSWLNEVDRMLCDYEWEGFVLAERSRVLIELRNESKYKWLFKNCTFNLPGAHYICRCDENYRFSDAVTSIVTSALFYTCVEQGDWSAKWKSENVSKCVIPISPQNVIFQYLKEKLTNSSYGYVTSLRPKKNHYDPLQVDVSIELKDINDLNDKGELDVHVTFIISWQDDYQKWNELSANLTDMGFSNDIMEKPIRMPTSLIWSPSWSLLNSADNKKDFKLPKDSIVQVYSDGTVIGDLFTRVFTSCAVSFYKYPFDYQICEMYFTFEGYDENEINWALVSTNKSELFQDSGIGKWNFQRQDWQIIPIIITRKSRQNLTSSVLIYKLYITRNNVNRVFMFVLMPTIIITSINIICYLLPIGDLKLTMSLTTFLTFIMLQGIVATIVPSEGKMPIIGQYSIMSSILSGINVLTSMILISLKESKLKLPDSIKKFIMQRLAKILLIDSKDIKKAFLFRNDMLDIWKTTPFTTTAEPTLHQLHNERDLSSIDAQTGETNIHNKQNEENLSVKLLQQQFEILDAMRKFLKAYLKKQSEKENGCVKTEQAFMAIMMNRVFAIVAVVLNIGFLIYTAICYVH